MYAEAKVAGLFTIDSHREIIDKYSKEGWRLLLFLKVVDRIVRLKQLIWFIYDEDFN